jgi:laminin alpha 3/5
VGNSINIKLEIRPRNNSGILVSVHGRRDYLVLQLIDGAVKISVDNGKGPIFSVYTPPNPYYFCDGQWHSIEGKYNYCNRKINPF